MAGKRIVIPNYMPALDINGNPVAGAKITFWENGTTTLKAIYTSATLAVQHPNPISADAAGVFPSIFADEAEEFSVAITDADGNPISGLRNRDNIQPSLAFLEGVGLAASAAVGSILGEDTLDDFTAAQKFVQSGTGATERSLRAKLREVAMSPQDFGAVGDGSTNDTTAYQSLITAAVAADVSSLKVPAGDWTISGSLTGGSTLTWLLEPGAEVTPGKLPGRVVPLAPPTWAAPQRMWVFGETPYTFEVSFTSGSSVSANSSSGAVTTTVNGICSTDRLTATFRGWTDGLIPQLVEPSTRNTVSARLWNVTGSSIAYGTRTAVVTVAKNTAYRQVFCLSRSQGEDSWLAGVDMESVKSACVWRTNNAGASWKPIYAVSANAIRSFVEVTANSSSSTSDALNTVMLATVADPNTAAELAWRSTDGFATASAITFTLSGSNAETVLLDGDVEGGQGSGSGSSRVILGSYRPSNAPATAFVSTDGGATFGSPIEIAAATTYDSCWSIKYISGSGASSVWLAFLHRNDATTLAPGVYRSTDGGSTWSLLTTVGAVGDEWQGVIKLASGTLLAGLDSSDGGVYRSTDSGATWTKVFTCASVVSSDTKARCFAESNSMVYMATQDAGHLWRSRDDGITWTLEWRFAQQSAPVCMSASTNIMLVGCGQGYTTSTPSRAEVYRLVRAPYRHQYG